MKKINTIILILLTFLVSCNEVDLPSSNNTGVTNTGDTDSGSQENISQEISSLSITNVTEDDFRLVGIMASSENVTDLDFNLYYCNETQNSGCDPKSGDTLLLTSSQLINQLVSNLDSSDYSPNDTINLLLEVNENTTLVDSQSIQFTLADDPSMTLNILSNEADGEAAVDSPTNYFNIDGEGGDQVFFGNWHTNGSRKMWVYLNFTLTKEIPAGSNVNSAYLTIGGDGRYQWDMNNYYANIYIQDSADAAIASEFNDTIGEANGNVSLASISWGQTNGLQWQGLNTTPNISSLIQSLVDKYDGLASGAKIQIWISTPSFGLASQLIYADYGHPNHFTELNIDWSYQ